MKIDPFVIARKAREVREVSVTDGEVTVTLWLRRPDFVDGCRIDDLTEELVETYITGTKLVPAVDFPFIGGEPVVVTRRICRFAASLAAMQKPPNPEDAYDAESLIALAAARGELFDQLLGKAADLAEVESGNALGEAMGGSSEPPSTQDADTQS